MRSKGLLVKLVWILVGLLIGFFVAELVPAGWYPGYYLQKAFVSSTNDPCAQHYPLTSQSLDCASYDDGALRIKSVDAAIDAAVAEYTAEGKVSRVSVWVRDLNTKQWASTNENEIYSPASLQKLPLAISYYKFAELNPTVMDKSVVYQTPSDLNDSYNYFTATSSVQPGKTYSVSDLIKAMLENSDNGASITLSQRVDPAFFSQTQTDLGLQLPVNNDVLDYVTVRSYANIFRMLYNASYLDRQSSQELLDIMSHSTFKGMASPLPQGIVVSHKFGERTVILPDGSIGKRELHDCGIIYKKPNPYTLCIMTEGQSFDDLLSVITGLSKIVYDKI